MTKHYNFIDELFNDYINNYINDNDIEDIVYAYCLNNNLTCNSVYDNFDELMNYFIKLKRERA